MRKSLRLICALLVAASGATVFPAVAVAQDCTTLMTGARVVPPVTTAARGVADVEINDDETQLSYVIELSGFSGPPTEAHIHFGQPGAVGGAVFTLAAATAGPDPYFIEGTLTAGDFTPVAGGPQSFSEAVQALRDGDLYVDVHTAAHPDGEVRGQLACPVPTPTTLLNKQFEFRWSGTPPAGVQVRIEGGERPNGLGGIGLTFLPPDFLEGESDTNPVNVNYLDRNRCLTFRMLVSSNVGSPEEELIGSITVRERLTVDARNVFFFDFDTREARVQLGGSPCLGDTSTETAMVSSGSPRSTPLLLLVAVAAFVAMFAMVNRALGPQALAMSDPRARAMLTGLPGRSIVPRSAAAVRPPHEPGGPRRT